MPYYEELVKSGIMICIKTLLCFRSVFIYVLPRSDSEKNGTTE